MQQQRGLQLDGVPVLACGLGQGIERLLRRQQIATGQVGLGADDAHLRRHATSVFHLLEGAQDFIRMHIHAGQHAHAGA